MPPSNPSFGRGSLSEEVSKRTFDETIRVLFTDSPLSIQVVSPEGNTLRVNEAWKKLWGISDQVVNDFILKDYNILNDTMLESRGLIPLVKKALQGEKMELPLIYLNPKELGIDGNDRWIRANFSPLFDEEGKVTEIVLMHIDVTSEIKAHESAGESTERFFQLAENLNDQVVHIMDINPHKIIYVSPSYEKIWRKPVSELYDNPESFIDRIHPEDRPNLFRAMKEQDSGKETSLEYRLLFEDGSVTWIKDRSIPLRDRNGIVFRATGIAEDVTSSKVAELKLKESEAKFRTITDALPQMVWSCTADGFHDYFNSQWYEFTGTSPGSSDGEDWSNIIHPDDKVSLSKKWTHSLKTGESYENECRVKHQSGHYRWVLGRALPLRDEFGKIVRWMGTCTDIQEMREAGESLTKGQIALQGHVKQLQHEQKLREHFVATLSHDLRTPLTTAKMCAQLLQKQNLTGENINRLTVQISDNMDRADQMIRNLLDANLLKAGQPLPLEISSCDLSDIVKRTVDEFSTLHGDRFDMSQVFPVSGYWSETGLKRVIENLLSNAIKYGFKDTPVKVALIRNLDLVSLTVHNFGDPIKIEDQRTLFQAFNRTESAKSSGHKGWGLGLTLVKGIVEAHGGVINIESSSAKGTSFIITLPIDCKDKVSFLI